MSSSPGTDAWPQIAAAVYYDDASAAIDFLCQAFGFEVRIRVDGEAGAVEHSELVYGSGVIMVSSIARDRPHRSHCTSPHTLDGANTQSLMVQVDDVDAHCEAARSAGAAIVEEPATQDYGPDYGAHRTYHAMDPEGHHWWFMKVVRGSSA